ncbi:MAG: radical SAM protein [Actinobacteria bacterium]|nr:radical SAM protein [Actinomycetota bacterium]
MSDVVRVLRFLPATVAEGPGRRAALWVQGCSIRCPGCFNPHSWPAGGGEPVGWTELAGMVRDAAAVHDIEGLTLLGGEPFDQAGPVGLLAEAVRAEGLSVMTFTGYVLEALRAAGRGDWGRLLAATDLLVDGPYLAERPEHRRPWVGSDNQRFWFLTDRYAHLAADLDAIPNRLEIRISRSGQVAVNGFATVATLEELLTGEAGPLRKRRR